MIDGAPGRHKMTMALRLTGPGAEPEVDPKPMSWDFEWEEGEPTHLLRTEIETTLKDPPTGWRNLEYQVLVDGTPMGSVIVPVHFDLQVVERH